jgi:hypothetical protein
MRGIGFSAAAPIDAKVLQVRQVGLTVGVTVGQFRQTRAMVPEHQRGSEQTLGDKGQRNRAAPEVESGLGQYSFTSQ